MSLWVSFKEYILRLINETPNTQKIPKELPILKELEYLRKTNNLNTVNYLHNFLNDKDDWLYFYYDDKSLGSPEFTIKLNVKIEQLHRQLNTIDTTLDTVTTKNTKYIYGILQHTLKKSAEFCLLESKKEFLHYNFVKEIRLRSVDWSFYYITVDPYYLRDRMRIDNKQLERINQSTLNYFKKELSSIKHNEELINTIDFLPYSKALRDYTAKIITHVEQLKQDFPYHAEQFSNKYHNTLSNINSVLQDEVEELDKISDENEQLIIDIVKNIEQESSKLLERLTSKKNTIEDSLKEAGIESRKTILQLEKEYLTATKELEIANETIDTATVIKDILNKEDKKKEGE